MEAKIVERKEEKSERNTLWNAIMEYCKKNKIGRE